MPRESSAINLAKLGWKVFPTVNRKPAFAGWPDLASSDTAQVRSWWQRWPDADPAIHAGASGLVVLDIDGIPGWQSMRVLEDLHGGPLPPTLKVSTGREHGEHWYYKRPVRGFCGNAVGIHGLVGLDIRADGGFVFAPRAHHPSGKTYEFIVRENCTLGHLRSLVAQLPEAPDCLINGDPCKACVPKKPHDPELISLGSDAWENP